MNTIQQANHISLKDLDRATATLFSAFENDPLMLWMFDGIDNYKLNAVKVIRTWVKWTILYGLAIATPEFEAVALRKLPGKHKFTLWQMIRSSIIKTPMLVDKKIFDNIMAYDNLSLSEQHKNMKSDNFWYCWLIGTEPHHRNQGHAKKLMDYTFDQANESKLPCYLETGTHDNVALHTKRGYELKSSFVLPHSTLQVFCMAREIISTNT